MVVAQLKDAENAPSAAAEIAHTLAIKAVTSTRDKQDPRLTVAAACRGALGGILLLEKDLPATAVALLQGMALVAQEANLDPSDCMTWGMEGIAPVCRMAPAATADAVREAIEQNFMGAGEVFSNILQAAGT